MYIERQLEKKFIAINEEYACVLLTGPRQNDNEIFLEGNNFNFYLGTINTSK